MSNIIISSMSTLSVLSEWGGGLCCLKVEGLMFADDFVGLTYKIETALNLIDCAACLATLTSYNLHGIQT